MSARLRALAALVLLALVAACAPARPARRAQAFDAQTVDVGPSWTNMAAGDDHAAIVLTASDGRVLAPSTIDARGVLYGPLAFTELHVTFAAGVSAGTFAIALPAGASVMRYATRVDHRWLEGDVVGRDDARARFGHTAKLVLDGVTGANVFRGQVTGAVGATEIVLAYTELFTSGTEPYRVLLAGLPRLERLDVQLLVARTAFVLRRVGEAPANDFVYRQEDEATAVRGGDFAVVRVAAPPPISDGTEPVAVLVDSSASNAKTYADDVERAARIVDRLSLKAPLVAAFDQDVAPLESIRAAVKRRPAGATDLRAALAWAESKQAKRAILVTDGLMTTGAEPSEAPGLERIDVIAARGMTRNVGPLRELAGSGRAAGAIVNGDDSDEAGARLLAAAGTTMRSVVVAGAKKSWPSDLAAGTTAATALAFVERHGTWSRSRARPPRSSSAPSPRAASASSNAHPGTRPRSSR